jgi:ferredoxin
VSNFPTEPVLNTLLTALGLLVFLGLGAFGVMSRREKERRAVRIAASMAVIWLMLMLFATTFSIEVKLALLLVIAAAGVATAILFVLPIGRVEEGDDVPSDRFDERDVVFARARLVPDSREFEAYYALRPGNRDVDEKIRALPGLLSLHAPKANPIAFASAKANFSLTEAMRAEVDGPVASVCADLTASQNTSMVKQQALYYGAIAVGITELEPYHVYSHIGRGTGVYGEPITLDHRYAIAFSVEMDHWIMGFAPEAPVVMESSLKYVQSGVVALTLGYLIRSLGYPARAHIDGNYRVIAPLVARDAALGEIGRMGILMTPRLGPRVRLGVVTTDLPLIPDDRSYDTSVQDFCRICVKCVDNCPSKAIPVGDRTEIAGVMRWRIDADRCFRYWNTIGTDCGICMSVCPYSHPDNLAHNLMRWAVRRSSTARRVALWLDDIFYGRVPTRRPASNFFLEK